MLCARGYLARPHRRFADSPRSAWGPTHGAALRSAGDEVKPGRCRKREQYVLKGCDRAGSSPVRDGTRRRPARREIDRVRSNVTGPCEQDARFQAT